MRNGLRSLLLLLLLLDLLLVSPCVVIVFLSIVERGVERARSGWLQRGKEVIVHLRLVPNQVQATTAAVESRSHMQQVVALEIAMIRGTCAISDGVPDMRIRGLPCGDAVLAHQRVVPLLLVPKLLLLL